MSQPVKNDSDSNLAHVGVLFEQAEQELEQLYESVATEFSVWKSRVGEEEYASMQTLVEDWGNKNVWSPWPHITAADEIVTLVLVTRRFLHLNSSPETTFQELFATNSAEDFLKCLTK